MRRAPSTLLAALSLAATAGAAGCGGEPEREPALAPVRLAVDSPFDTASVDAGTITVSGTVRPAGTRVLVAGDEASVDGNAFTAVVDLEPGANVIDVAAGAPRRPAAMTAVRVTRLVPVEVPDLDGLEPEDAERELEALGLGAELSRGGGLLDELIPGSLGVCGTDPPAGEQVRPGSTVTVEIANAC